MQIAPYSYGDEASDVLPKFWEAQTAALEIPHTGMVIIHDVGDPNDIHPKNKQEVGRRLALVALAKTYNQEVIYSGPLYRSMQIKGDKNPDEHLVQHWRTQRQRLRRRPHRILAQ